MDVVVLVVKNKRAHLRRIQNISFCANDATDVKEEEESFYEESHHLIFWKEERDFNIISSSHSSH